MKVAVILANRTNSGPTTMILLLVSSGYGSTVFFQSSGRVKSQTFCGTGECDVSLVLNYTIIQLIHT